MDLLGALTAYRGVLIDYYENEIRSKFQRLVAELGPELKNIANCWSYDFYRELREGEVLEILPGFRKVSYRRTDPRPFGINDAKLKIYIEKYVVQVLETWKMKIKAKLGELENTEVVCLKACTYEIKGTRNGHSVNMVQNITLNVSVKGALFTQFPARIYVDGKFISAAKYKRLMGSS